MTIFLVSDTHFGHENMILFMANDKRRVRYQFNSAYHCDEEMIARWNRVVKPQDHVYHLGDVAMKREHLQTVKRLNGKKRLVLGNHDVYDMKSYKEVGFEKIFGSRRLDGWLLTHIPVHPDSIAEKLKGNVHGHIHRQPTFPGKYVNVSVEVINYTPIALEDLKV